MSIQSKSIFRLFVTTFFVLAFSVGTACAAAACYHLDEAEAEQGIRIHSELMVIGLNCQNMQFQDGTNLYVKYRNFTNRNADLFAEYETDLMSYFRRTGANNPEAKLNTMRTSFANKISLDAAKMKPYNFCNRYARRIFEVDNMSQSEIRKWAATFHESHPLSQPICEQ